MKRTSPSAARNSAPIADVLAKELPETGLVLEVASGTGEHAVFMAARFPALQWQPTDRDPAALESIASWVRQTGYANLAAPLELDAKEGNWPVVRADALLCINMVHISPWAATQGLFERASQVLTTGAPLILYGPSFENGKEAVPSNLAFDTSLRSRDPAWGIRYVSEMDDLAEHTGFVRTARHHMPANNLTLVYRRK
ncbi:DUF938 domain-containing protein [Qipengyuania huizhouensis]|uniref:DUF938 domain-containing protein n=1 Tax=Qipengyuania huizhouensis TaxID=2867245 RepID=UPI001858B6BE|nr:DUF938 domain-containing protein [Qipengyuania huizhouensis]MBA4764642.1 DUF938 domain-containing protein [Erythrobacter sp.]MBX7461233.1 DUF938 domain-containing protein [Qipengyuania huizhouensis]